MSKTIYYPDMTADKEKPNKSIKPDPAKSPKEELVYGLSKDIINRCIEDVKKYENEQLNKTEPYTDVNWEMSTTTVNVDEEDLDYLKQQETLKQIKLQLHNSILKDIHELYETKNNDYGDSVSQTYQKYGMVSFLVRMEDKLNRIKSLTVDNNKTKVSTEKVEDTLMDLANYAILAIVELKTKQLMDQ